MKTASECRPTPTPEAARQALLLLGARPGSRADLRDQFARRGHTVSAVRRPEEATRALRRETPAAAVLDLEGSGEAGLALIRTLRDQSPLPIVVLMEAEEEVVEIVALKYGADLVMRKDCSANLVVERVGALLRRSRMASLEGERERGILQRGELVMDLAKIKVTWKGRPVSLTRTEFALLRFLAERPGHLRSRDQIYDEIYGGDTFVLDRTIDSHVKRIRRKLRDVDPDFNAIDTLYGMGYRFDVEG
jgi:two-component system response regulator ChvI